MKRFPLTSKKDFLLLKMFSVREKKQWRKSSSCCSNMASSLVQQTITMLVQMAMPSPVSCQENWVFFTGCCDTTKCKFQVAGTRRKRNAQTMTVVLFCPFFLDNHDGTFQQGANFAQVDLIVVKFLSVRNWGITRRIASSLIDQEVVLCTLGKQTGSSFRRTESGSQVMSPLSHSTFTKI